MLIISLIAVIGRDYSDKPVILSLLLTYTMTIQNSLTWTLKGFMNI